MQFLQLELTKAQERQRRSAAPPADLTTSSSSANNRRRNMEAVVRPILQQVSDGTTTSSSPSRPPPQNQIKQEARTGVLYLYINQRDHYQTTVSPCEGICGFACFSNKYQYDCFDCKDLPFY